MNARGLTLLETMVALVILGLVVVGYLGVFSGTVRSAQAAEIWSQAIAYAEDAVERYKIEGTSPGLGSREQLPGGYTRWVEMEPWADSLIRITAVVVLPGGGEFRLSRLARAP